MRLIPIALALGLVAPVQTPLFRTRQVWEKPLSPGVTFRMELDPSGPWVAYALRTNLKAPNVRVESGLTGRTVYDDTVQTGRGTVTRLAADYQAQAAINADFFPFSANNATGDPLGFMLRNGELLSTPSKSRSVLGWGPDFAGVNNVDFSGAVKLGSTTVDLDGINQDCPLNSVVLNSPAAGWALSKAPTSIAVIDFGTKTMGPEGTMTGTVGLTGGDADKVAVPNDKFVLVGQGDKAATIGALKSGDKVTVTWKATGFDWKRTTNVVGGGPRLLANGEIAVAKKEEGFAPAFSDVRHPRTMVGYAKDGTMWWVVVDGRQKSSDGMNLAEAAAYMKRLGCTDAINLDGGGSSALSLFGASVNKPSGGQERAVANGVVFFFPAPNAKSGGFTISRSANRMRLLDAKKVAVPDRNVIWFATGPALIDQSGVLMRYGDGPVQVQAWSAGAITTITVEK